MAQQQQQPALGSASKRKKWTEEEERSLLEKYSEMQRDGSLAKMKTREKKFRPIAAHVNAAHHAQDPSLFPFQWSWKDASTKVQNMRHQYLLVKQKLSAMSDVAAHFPWEDGLSLWPNFLRYKEVFGDVPLPGNLGLGLGFDCDVDGVEEGFDFEETSLQVVPPSTQRKKRKKKTFESQISRLLRLEERLEEREEERERERKRREELSRAEWEERERGFQEMRREMEEDWRDRRRRQEEEDREWEEKSERRRLEWKKNMESMLTQHRIEMDQLQSRVLHVQQSMIAQIVGLVAQWSLPNHQSGGGLPDAGGFSGHHHHHGHPHHNHQQVYVSQMMQSLHHLNGIIHPDSRVDGDSQDDQFIVDDA